MKNNGSKVLKKVGKKWVAFALVGAGVALGNTDLVSANEIVGSNVGEQIEVQASTEVLTGVENTEVESNIESVSEDIVQDKPEEVATSVETISERSVNTEEPEIMLLEATSTTQDLSNVAESTAVIEVNSSGNTVNKYNVTVDTKIPQASNGDYVDYTFENLPVGDLEGKELKTNDGVVIGSLSVLVDENTFNNKVDNASKETIDSNTIYNSAIVRATFNENVNALKDISYSFSYTGQGIVFYPNKDVSTVKTKISTGSKVVAELDAPTLPYSKEKIETVIYMDGPYTFANVSENGDITASQLQLEIKSGVGGVKAGTDYTLSWTDDSNFKLKPENIEVGTELILYNQGAYTDSSYVNDAGYIFYNKVPSLSVKVTSVTDKSITVTTLSDLPENTKFGSTIKGDVFTVSPTKAQLDVSRSRITSVENISTVNGVVKDVEEMDYVNLKGSVASAAASKKIGTVIENNVSTTGEKLTDTITVVSNVSVGTAYDTSAQDEKITLADGRVFKLKTKGANSTGKVIEGTTEVVNTYEEVKGSVFEDNFIEGTTTKLTDTVTVVSKASVGSAYDSSAQEEVITLADGKSYKLVSKDTNSTGKVAETDTYLANYYSEIKGSVVVKFVDTAGNTISEDVVDTKDSSTGVSYDTTDNKPTMILVKNADDTVTAYTFKEISDETSAETGKVVAGETVVTYVYEEVAIVPVKDVLNKDGESVDGGKATVGDVLTFVLDGSPISDGIQGGLWQYDLKDVLDTAKVEYIDGSVKVYAGEFANITLPDGSVLKADDDISSYVTIEYVDGVLTIKPTKEFYTILQDNGVEDLVDIDAQFDVKVIADGTIENTLIQVVNGFEFNSNTTTTEAEVPVVETPAEEPVTEAEAPVVKESKQSEATLPNTGTENSYALSVMGVLALFGSLLGFRKKKETE